MKSHQSTASKSPKHSAAEPSPHRCKHTSRTGRPCRYFASPDSRFCKHHSRDERPDTNDDLAAELAEAAGDFSSPGNVQRVMAKIFHALVQRRISTREAGVLCYIAQTILHTHRAVLQNERYKAQTEVKTAEQRKEELGAILWAQIRNLPGGGQPRRPIPRIDPDPKPPQPSTNQSRNDSPTATASVPPVATAATHSPAGMVSACPEPRRAAPNNSSRSGALTPEATTEQPKKSPATSVTAEIPTKVLNSPISSTSSTSSTSSKPPDLNHFYHRDPTLPVTMQHPSTHCPAPPEPEAIAPRSFYLKHKHGFRQ